MNNKGFATLGIAASILIITTIMIATFSSPMINTTKNVKNTESETLEYVQTLSGRERLFSKLKDDVAFKGKLTYDDLNVEYEVREIQSKYIKEQKKNEEGKIVEVKKLVYREVGVTMANTNKPEEVIIIEIDRDINNVSVYYK